MTADLNQERGKIKINPDEISHLLYGRQRHETILKLVDRLKPLRGDYECYNRGRISLIKDSIRVSE